MLWKFSVRWVGLSEKVPWREYQPQMQKSWKWSCSRHKMHVRVCVCVCFSVCHVCVSVWVGLSQPGVPGPQGTSEGNLARRRASFPRTTVPPWRLCVSGVMVNVGAESSPSFSPQPRWGTPKAHVILKDSSTPARSCSLSPYLTPSASGASASPSSCTPAPATDSGWILLLFLSSPEWAPFSFFYLTKPETVFLDPRLLFPSRTLNVGQRPPCSQNPSRVRE